MTVKLLAFAASHREGSLNAQLLAMAVSAAQAQGAEVTVRDYAAYDAPLYRGETKRATLPEGAERFSTDLLSHDGVLMAVPEYNWSIPGGLKNVIDWLSVDTRQPMSGKTALLMCASPSARGGITGLQHLRTVLEVLRMWTYPQMIGIGRAQEQLGSGATLSNAADHQHMVSCVADFVRATAALKGAPHA